VGGIGEGEMRGLTLAWRGKEGPPVTRRFLEVIPKRGQSWKHQLLRPLASSRPGSEVDQSSWGLSRSC
jgi:hypothetical protein